MFVPDIPAGKRLLAALWRRDIPGTIQRSCDSRILWIEAELTSLSRVVKLRA